MKNSGRPGDWEVISEGMRKFVLSIVLLLLILIIGTLGYMFLEDISFWNGLYLTAITITTVGYGDLVPLHPGGKVFTVLLIFAGVSYVMYVFGKITEAMVDGSLRAIMERSKMEKKIARLRDHYIICGFGRIGKVICEVLQENERPFLVIDRKEEEIKELEKLRYIFMEGDASEDSVLLYAGIKRARGLIAVVSSDADNLFITLTARGLNPDLFILTRSSGAKGAETKLFRAGATRVISPYKIGARRMAHLIVRPTVIDFIDLTMHASDLGLRMEELLVSEKSGLVDKNLMESGIRQRYNIIVVAIKRADTPMLFNPMPDTQIQAGDILIVLGDHDQITALENEM